MFLPYRSKNPPESFPFATIGLIVVNTVIYFATMDSSGNIRREVVEKWALTGQNISPLTILSSMFLHGNPLHLIGNMYFLYLLGFAVEGRLKTVKYLILYLLAGVTGDLLHHLLFGISSPTVPTLGASGAIMGVLGAALWMFPFGKVRFFYIGRFYSFFNDGDWWGSMDLPMWGVCAYYLGFDILAALITAGSKVTGGVAHFAHLGGAAGGFFICMLMRPKRDSASVSESKSTLDETKDLSILSRRDLGELHAVNPTDDLVLLHWMHRCIRDNRIEPECQKTFLAAMPRLVREAEPLSLAMCVMTLGATPGLVRPAWIIEVAGRTERANDGGLAIRLYEMAFADPETKDAEHETCLFRVGMISESVFQNYGRATACYKQVVDRWPMSPMAEQAKARLKVTEPRASLPTR
jgi:membrane associated rhomboid family serine protease